MTQARLFSALPVEAAFGRTAGMVTEFYNRLGQDITQPDLEWRAGMDHPQLQQMVQWRPATRQMLSALRNSKHTDVQSFAHFDYREVNNWLLYQDLPIQLDPWSGDGQFGIVGKVEFKRRWLMQPERKYALGTLPAQGFRFPVTPTSLASVQVYAVGNTGAYLVEIPTEYGSTWVCDHAAAGIAGYGLLQFARYMVHHKRSVSEFTGVIFPQFQIAVDRVDLDWMKSLYAVDERGLTWIVTQAMMCGKSSFGVMGWQFKMGFAGGIAALGIDVLNQPGPQDLVLDRDVVVWETLRGEEYPLGVVAVPTSEFANEDVFLA